MAFILSPNMSLPVPAVGSEPGPNYAFDVNSSLTLVDQHDHSPGRGVQITPAGMNINAALSFQGNNITNMGNILFTQQASSLSLGALYTAPGGETPPLQDLFYNDSAGNVVQLTKAGTVNATIASIPGESYAAGTFTWVQGDGSTTPANFDIGSITIRPNVAATTNGVTLNPPAAIASAYTLALPNNPSALSNTAFLTLDTSGNIVGSISTVAGITASNIANQTITATQIANNTITGTQIVSNINLPGDAVQEDGKNLVVSGSNATTSLAIVRGQVDSSGNLVLGEGFTSSRTSTGRYALTWDNAFSDTPVVVATLQGQTISVTIEIASTTTTSADVRTINNASTPINEAFYFIAIGQR